jgi:hypothetical protein
MRRRSRRRSPPPCRCRRSREMDVKENGDSARARSPFFCSRRALRDASRIHQRSMRFAERSGYSSLRRKSTAGSSSQPYRGRGSPRRGLRFFERIRKCDARRAPLQPWFSRAEAVLRESANSEHAKGGPSLEGPPFCWVGVRNVGVESGAVEVGDLPLNSQQIIPRLRPSVPRWTSPWRRLR